MTTYLTPEQLYDSLVLRDLSDPQQGSHAIQQLLNGITETLTAYWGCTTRTVRNPPLVSVRDNYDRLGYRSNDVTRDQRYTRYTSPTTMLRSHTTANIPHALERYQNKQDVDELIVVPGLIYRRDTVDRTHVGEPHQVDLWRIRSTPQTSPEDLLDLASKLVEAVLPGARWRTTRVEHPYTVGGQQVDVWHDGEWLELAECGRIYPGVLRDARLDPSTWSGLALGMGLDRALMLRKGIPDIRYLRADDPRIAGQMCDLEPWRPVSVMPAISRDMSVVIDEETDEETIGDTIRNAMGKRANDIESIQTLTQSAYQDLSDQVRERLGIKPGQVNALVRLTLRPLERTLTAAEANRIRNEVYLALHCGPNLELVQADPHS